MLANDKKNLVFDTIEKLARQTSSSDVGTLFSGAMMQLGFSFSGISGLPQQGEGVAPPLLTQSAPEGFLEWYAHENYYPHDHVAAHARTTVEAFRFSDAPPSNMAAPGDRRRYMQVLRSFGISEGVIVPLGRPIGMPACVWLAGGAPDMDADLLPLVQLSALFATSKAADLAKPQRRNGRVLTPREREVLGWAAQGKSAWEIGEILSIAKRTVDEHTQASARKLGAVNKTQAVALALVRNEIEL